MASRALFQLSRPLRRTAVPSLHRGYATTKPAAPKFVPARKVSTTPTQAEIDEEVLAGTSTPAESVPSSASLRDAAPAADNIFPEPGAAHPPMTPEPAAATGMGDSPLDWSRSYHGLSSQPFPKEVADVLLAPIDPLDVEIKPGSSLSSLSPYVSRLG
jgi:hypothetical protein